VELFLAVTLSETMDHINYRKPSGLSTSGENWMMRQHLELGGMNIRL
jgi:hypothetical protein